MRVHLLPDADGPPRFVDEPAPDPARRDGPPSFAERASARLSAAVRDARGRWGRMLRNARDWAARRIGADEPLLRRLRAADALEVVHPATMTEDEARSAWGAYLSARRRRHAAWLAVDLCVCPVSVLLAPLPGPNVLGYWFVYRAACHALALLGASRAVGGRLPTTYAGDRGGAAADLVGASSAADGRDRCDS